MAGSHQENDSATGPILDSRLLKGTVDGRNPFRTTLKPWLKPLFVGFCKGIIIQGFLGGAKWISCIYSISACTLKLPVKKRRIRQPESWCSNMFRGMVRVQVPFCSRNTEGKPLCGLSQEVHAILDGFQKQQKQNTNNNNKTNRPRSA